MMSNLVQDYASEKQRRAAGGKACGAGVRKCLAIGPRPLKDFPPKQIQAEMLRTFPQSAPDNAVARPRALSGMECYRCVKPSHKRPSSRHKRLI